MSEVDIKALFKAGAHFGHKTSRWHPKMAPYIHSKRAGIHVIDLEQTLDKLKEAAAFLESIAAAGKQILYVGTKRQAAPIISKSASSVDMPYVDKRWFGGLLTNYTTISERVKYLKKLEQRMESGELANRYNKREVQQFQEEIDQMNDAFGGIKEMSGLPGAIFVIDILAEDIAVKEARKLGIASVAIVDSNANPQDVDYPIPANDDAVKTLGLVTDYITEAISRGKLQHKSKPIAPVNNTIAVVDKAKAKTAKPKE